MGNKEAAAVGAVWCTDDVPAAERFDYWRHVQREVLGNDLHLYGFNEWFRSRCAIHELGAMRAAVLSYGGGPAPSGGETHRRAGLTTQLDAYEIKFSIACEQFALAQDGREARLRPGDFAVADMTRPSTATAIDSRPKRVVTFTVPRTMFPLPPSQVAKLTAVPMSGQRGSAALVSGLLRRISADADTYDPAEAAKTSTAVVDLIATALAGRLEMRSAVAPEAQRNAMLRRVYAYIDQHLGDPGLSPGTVAAAHHISLRQLHKLFAAEEHTVAEWIRRRRLDRCRRDLTDPALADRPIGAIAARWGFADVTSFYRLFRVAHGTPPGEYRRQKLGG